LIMMADVHDQSQCAVATFFWLNICFTIFFVLEASIKLLGHAPRWYFVDAWNVFDFFVVCASVFTLVLDYLAGDHTCTEGPAKQQSELLVQLSQLGILRAIRILRVLRLVRRVEGIRNLLKTLIDSLGSLASVAGLLMLMMTIFAVLGVNLFYNVSPDQDIYGNVGGANSPDNYRSWENAILLLLRQTTGEAWNSIMHYCMQDDMYKACDKAYGPYLGDGCGGPITGVMFHVIWQLLGTYVLMQLFTAIIIENFSEVADGGDNIISVERMNEFVDVWSELDSNCLGCIPHEQLYELIAQVRPPIGLKGKPLSSSKMMNVIKDLHVPIRYGKVHYFETFAACIKRVTALQDTEDDDIADEKAAHEAALQSVEEGARLKERNKESKERNKESQPDTQALKSPRSMRRENTEDDGALSDTRATAGQVYAALRLQQAYHEWKESQMQVVKGVRMTFQIPLNADPDQLKAR